MITKQITLNNRSNKILKVLKSEDLIKLECASTILSFILDEPDKKFIEYAGGIFPFAENEFEWVFSNAVIEHVGNKADQLVFLNEMLRVGKNVFFTTPNKWFPIESHTNALFRHWFDEPFYKWSKSNQPYWIVDNLLLFGREDIVKILEQSNAGSYKIQSNRTLGWPMTFTVVCSTKNS